MKKYISKENYDYQGLLRNILIFVILANSSLIVRKR